MLNARERVGCAYDCEEADMITRMSNAIQRRRLNDEPLSFSFSIDATKVPEVLEVSSAFRLILGGAYPHHKIPTSDKDAKEIKAILDKSAIGSTKIEKASEVKVLFMVFQQGVSKISPVEIISARPQGNNETSAFTQAALAAGVQVTKTIPNTSFLLFAVDGVSVETVDVMNSICMFLCGSCDCTGAVDNKHNIKNDRYQFIGGSCLPTIGNLVVDADLLRQAEVSADLLRVKDFASDKKVETLVSYKTLKVLSSALSSGKAVGLIEDAGALACTLMFM